MRIPLNQLYLSYHDIGEGPVHGYGQDGFGIASIIGEQNLTG